MRSSNRLQILPGLRFCLLRPARGIGLLCVPSAGVRDTSTSRGGLEDPSGSTCPQHLRVSRVLRLRREPEGSACPPAPSPNPAQPHALSVWASSNVTSLFPSFLPVTTGKAHAVTLCCWTPEIVSLHPAVFFASSHSGGRWSQESSDGDIPVPKPLWLPRPLVMAQQAPSHLPLLSAQHPPPSLRRWHVMGVPDMFAK